MNDDMALLARLLTAGAPNSVQPTGSMFPPVSGQIGMGMLFDALPPGAFANENIIH